MFCWRGYGLKASDPWENGKAFLEGPSVDIQNVQRKCSLSLLRYLLSEDFSHRDCSVFPLAIHHKYCLLEHLYIVTLSQLYFNKHAKNQLYQKPAFLCLCLPFLFFPSLPQEGPSLKPCIDTGIDLHGSLFSLAKLAYSFKHDRYLLCISGMGIDSMDLGLSILQMVERKKIWCCLSSKC